jgi:hypothetical protein
MVRSLAMLAAWCAVGIGVWGLADANEVGAALLVGGAVGSWSYVQLVRRKEFTHNGERS